MDRYVYVINKIINNILQNNNSYISKNNSKSKSICELSSITLSLGTKLECVLHLRTISNNAV